VKLYLMPPSGNSHKVRILLALLQRPYEAVVLNAKARDHKQPAFLKLNPRGEVPVLEDGGTVVWDSAACLVYLARKFGGEQWLPSEPAQMAQVMQWVALAGNEIQFGLQYARRGVLQGRWTAGTLEQGQAMGRVALAALEGRLQHHDWLALDRPTIADIACFPYIETAPEAKVALEQFPQVIAWLERCRKLPGWPERLALRPGG
jgi:glutathione S-transferase